MVYKAFKPEAVGVKKSDPDSKKTNIAESKTDDAVKANLKNLPVTNDEKSYELNLNNETLLNGIILSEILSKPKCFRKGRW